MTNLMKILEKTIPLTYTPRMSLLQKSPEWKNDSIDQSVCQPQLLQDKDLVLVLGNTGCGKSTMLNALIYGSESLNEVEIKEDIKTQKPDGTCVTQTKTRKVIERKFDKHVL